MGFDPSFKCLSTLKSCDTTKQSVCGWQYIYIYIYIYIYTWKNKWINQNTDNGFSNDISSSFLEGLYQNEGFFLQFSIGVLEIHVWL